MARIAAQRAGSMSDGRPAAVAISLTTYVILTI